MSIETRRTKAGATYYVVRVKSGRQLIATKAFDRRREAETWERQQKHLLETGQLPPPKRSFTLDGLITAFLDARRLGNPHTVATDQNNLDALPRALRARSLTSIHATDMRDHLLAQLRGGKAPSTVARAKTTLSALFTFAFDQGLLSQPHPIRAMKKIPELSTNQPSLRASEIPTPDQVTAAIVELRERRPDIADVVEFMALTGVRWGELRALRVNSLVEIPLIQLLVERSHSEGYDEKAPKSWRGIRAVPLSPRAVAIFRQHSAGKDAEDYLFTNLYGSQLKVGVVRKFPLGFHRHALRHFAASTWLRLGVPVHEVAEYLGDEARTVLKVYAHVLGEGQRRDFVRRLAANEAVGPNGGHLGDTWAGSGPGI